MDYVLLTVSIALFVVSGVILRQIQLQRYALQALIKEYDIQEPANDPEMVLTLRVTDPISVAKRESRSARVLADRLPIVVTKMVYQEVMKELDQELRSREIDVDMAIEYR